MVADVRSRRGGWNEWKITRDSVPGSAHGNIVTKPPFKWKHTVFVATRGIPTLKNEKKKEENPDRKRQPRPIAQPFAQKEHCDSVLPMDSSRLRTESEESYEFLINPRRWMARRSYGRRDTVRLCRDVRSSRWLSMFIVLNNVGCA